MQNLNSNQNFISLNGAGKLQNDPILKGLPFTITFEFNDQNQLIDAFIDSTELSLTQLGNTFYCNLVAGNAPTKTGQNTLRLVATSQLGNVIKLEQVFYISEDLPLDLIEAYDVYTEEWTSLIGKIPMVGQMMAIRFMQSYYDEFEVSHFGGVGVISVSDFPGLSVPQVRQILNQDIKKTYYVYLQKQQIGVQETHKFIIWLKAKSTGGALSFTCQVTTPPCIALEIQEPQTSP